MDMGFFSFGLFVFFVGFLHCAYGLLRMTISRSMLEHAESGSEEGKQERRPVVTNRMFLIVGGILVIIGIIVMSYSSVLPHHRQSSHAQ